ncbi:uncharacterized protein CDAR_104051 [Caerostris darwini]|uniref:Uncharacterized protein n=1 Tax=Caerostris darwini TaxID=1538125 RepID=A0AAV4T0V9_9ARAC|nr:uncharacterized protein CDAR_104051 [Caerostris darwini]
MCSKAICLPGRFRDLTAFLKRSRCDFMDGICHESPRWVSLLVAETYYPDTFIPTATTAPPPPPPVEDFYNFQQYLKRRVGEVDDDPTLSGTTCLQRS